MSNDQIKILNDICGGSAPEPVVDLYKKTKKCSDSMNLGRITNSTLALIAVLGMRQSSSQESLEAIEDVFQEAPVEETVSGELDFMEGDRIVYSCDPDQDGDDIKELPAEYRKPSKAEGDVMILVDGDIRTRRVGIEKIKKVK